MNLTILLLAMLAFLIPIIINKTIDYLEEKRNNKNKIVFYD